MAVPKPPHTAKTTEEIADVAARIARRRFRTGKSRGNPGQFNVRPVAWKCRTRNYAGPRESNPLVRNHHPRIAGRVSRHARDRGAVQRAGCDAYIPLSLLLPLLVLAGAAVTSVLAVIQARQDRNWFIFLVANSALGVFGPVLSLTILRDNPDAFVILSTVLVLLVPVSALPIPS